MLYKVVGVYNVRQIEQPGLTRRQLPGSPKLHSVAASRLGVSDAHQESATRLVIAPSAKPILCQALPAAEDADHVTLELLATKETRGV